MKRKVLAIAVSSALAAPMAAHAVKYKLSGQVNRAIVYGDDGEATDVQFIDNTTSGTRWRMTGSEEIGGGMKVGFNWEWQNSTNAGGGDIKSGDTGDTQSMRIAEVWFGGDWGKLSLGKGSGAGDGTTELDLTSTWNAGAYVIRDDIGGNYSWRTGGGGFLPGRLTHGDTFNNFDAFSRYDRIRYDSPAMGPVTLSASAGQNHKWEIAARVGSAIGGGQLLGGLFYGEASGVKNRYGGSVSYLFAQGTSIMGSYASNDPDSTASEGTNWYAKIGHNWGNNSVSAGYGESENVVDGYTDSGFNVGFNHTLPKAQVDIYAGYQWNELEVPAGVASAEDQQSLTVGTKVRFE